jgi:hypothetical protein
VNGIAMTAFLVSVELLGAKGFSINHGKVLSWWLAIVFHDPLHLFSKKISKFSFLVFMTHY